MLDILKILITQGTLSLLLSSYAVAQQEGKEEVQKAKLTRLGLFFYNTAYSDEQLRLFTPENDAKVLSGLFKRNCLVESYVVGNLSLDDFNKWLEAIHKKVGSVESLFFYYGGHGFQLSGANHIKMIIQNESVSINALLSRLAIFSPKTTVLMLDCCRNNLPSNDLSGGQARGTKGLVAFDISMKDSLPSRDYSLIVSYAAAPDEAALDVDPTDKEHSPYAAAFKRALYEKRASLKHVLDTVQRLVRENTLRQQEPWLFQDAPASLLDYPLVLKTESEVVDYKKMNQDVKDDTESIRRRMEARKATEK